MRRPVGDGRSMPTQRSIVLPIDRAAELGNIFKWMPIHGIVSLDESLFFDMVARLIRGQYFTPVSLYSSGLYTYGLHSYGLYSYGDRPGGSTSRL